MPLHQKAAALDIGSNTLKMLVVENTAEDLVAIGERTSETRISEGISKDHPELTEGSMQKGVRVIGELFKEIQSYDPDHIRIVATSAVRDANNRDEFCKRVKAATGHEVDILSGEEEARLVGKGALTDPNLKAQKEIMIFDMGGGSVECIYIKDREIKMTESLPLGGVRLKEHHLTDAAHPMTAEEKSAVASAIESQVSRLHHQLENPNEALVVGAGGTWITSRVMLADREGKTLEQSSPYLSHAQLQSVFDQVSKLTLEERLKVPKLPSNRADVFPVTLLALLELGKWSGASNYYHCFRSLRYGVADELLNG